MSRETKQKRSLFGHRKRHRAADSIKPQWSLNNRIIAFFCFIVFVFVILIGNLFYIQVIRGPKLQSKALSQWTRTTTLTAARGEILDRDGNVLATTGTVYKVLLWPEQISDDDMERVVEGLSTLLELDYDSVLKKASSETLREVVLKRQVDADTAAKIKQLKLGRGVGVAMDSKRYYPYGKLLSQVIGFTNIDNEGQSGLELSYEKYLHGQDGRMVAEIDRDGNELSNGATEYIAPVDGASIVTTISTIAQSYLEKSLQEALEVNNAANAQGIIMDVNTGAIVAISTKPDYDPNNPPRDDLDLLAELSRNRIVTDIYEPGSTFKILTLSAALDSSAATLDSTFNCDGGYTVNGERIKCWRHAGHGSQNLTEATENSCNCCFMQLALRMGTEEFYDYLYAFGLGQSTGSNLLGETTGIVTHEKYVRENDLARIGFGQSIAVTPLQLAAAVSAAVNGGELYTPHIVDRIVSADGSIVFEADTSPVRRVVSEETSATVRTILQSVVDNGTGRNAQVPGYAIGGKTGTAQKYDEFGAVSAGNYICSFIGFAPADAPQYVCLILVDEPKVGSIFGSTVAAPYVKKVFEELLPYAGILSTEQSETLVLNDYCGKTIAEAAEALEAIGLEAIYEDAEDALITAQVPAAGQTVVAGSSVLLYTGMEGVNDDASAPETVIMPDLMGMTPLEAHDALAAIGLTMISEPEDPSGEVVAQGVPEGSSVEIGSGVIVRFEKPSSSP